MILRTLLEADRELQEAAAYYEEQGPGLGERFLAAAEQAHAEIQRHPEAFPLVQGSNQVRRARFAGFPYYVVFLPSSAEVVLIAYSHVRRRPGYWSDRLAEDDT